MNKINEARRKFLVYGSASLASSWLAACGGDDGSTAGASSLTQYRPMLAASDVDPSFSILSLIPRNYEQTISDTITSLETSLGKGTFSASSLITAGKSDDAWEALAVIGETVAIAFANVVFPEVWPVTGIATIAFTYLNGVLSGSDSSSSTTYPELIKKITGDEISSSNMNSLTSLVAGIQNTFQDYNSYLESLGASSNYSSSQTDTIKTKEESFSDNSCETNLPQFINSNVGVQGLPLYSHVAAIQLMSNYEILVNKSRMDPTVFSSSDVASLRDEAVARYYRHQNSIANLFNQWAEPLNNSGTIDDANKKYQLLRGVYVNGLSEFYLCYKYILMEKYGKKIKIRNSAEISSSLSYNSSSKAAVTGVEASINQDLINRTSYATRLAMVGHIGDGDPVVLRVTQNFVDGVGNTTSLSVETCTGNPPANGSGGTTTSFDQSFPVNQFSGMTKDGSDLLDHVNFWDNGGFLYAINFGFPGGSSQSLVAGQPLDSSSTFPINSETGYYVSSVVVSPGSDSKTCLADSGVPVGFTCVTFRHCSSIEQIAKISSSQGVEVDLTCGFDRKSSSSSLTAKSDLLIGKSVILIGSGESAVFNIENTGSSSVNAQILFYASSPSGDSSVTVNGVSSTVTSSPSQFIIGISGDQYSENVLSSLVTLKPGGNNVNFVVSRGVVGLASMIVIPS
ncbi:insecticidal delta-endotoxin Cry8Ea1 family protein [Burkholderia cepacia]|uniref:insecticidal delta-endotoxin Cry8Ea1 family protein n=1 Tax=Burkholderia cepacia TaxID=292 RepID=UPI002AB64612|nr:insecticidal delta-endotoxin Cry8Ea1 family protein [Burkholderia cepacia]